MSASPIKVLLVEDSPSDAELLQEKLAQINLEQFAFTHVDRLEEAVERLREDHFDVLLLDLSLPDSSGQETFLRARAVAPQAPIVVLTGASDDQVGLEAVRHGVQDYLFKSEADGRQIARAIRYAIERQQAEEALRRAETALEQANEDLSAANRKLQVVNEDLERRVTERTAELEQRTVQLRALASELTRAEERERRRLAQLLHDHLQQLLVSARYNLHGLPDSSQSETFKKTIRRADALLGECLEVASSLTAELSPTVLYDGGLPAALKWLGRWCRENHQLTVEVKADAETVVEPEEIRVALFQAVRELLFNVVKHARVKAARVEISRTPDARVQVVVSDKGSGFDPAHIRVQGGFTGGFGLFNLRERLEMLGGKMEIESAPGRGSRFTLSAPLSQPSASVAPASAAPVSIQKPPSRKVERAVAPGQKTRVLLADDHAVLREGLRQVLQGEADIEVVGEATDGQTAVKLAAKLQPDVVIMDVNMPQLNGIDATRQITSALPLVRVIGLSMFEDPSRAAAMRAAGAVAYLTKTGPAQNLVSSIRACARGKRVMLRQAKGLGRAPTS